MALEDYFEPPWQLGARTFVLRTLAIATAFLLALQIRKALLTRAKLKHIPTVGSSGLITSWIDAFKYIFHGKEIIQEGYAKYYGSTFKVPLIDKWMVVVSGAEKIDDIRKSTLEQLSSLDATIDLLQMNHTMGRNLCVDPYQTEVVRGALTRNIVTCFSDVQDEIKVAFEDYIPMTDDWIEVSAYETILQIVCRASNRMFIGLPICRDPDYIKLNIDFTIDVFVYARIINLFPRILKPLLGTLFTPRRRALAKMMKFLNETIRERLHQENVHGKDWPGKPNDLLSWLIDATHGDKERRTIQDLSSRMLSLNLGAIHTTSMTFTTALYTLAIHPEYAETLRTEVESVINAEGCTKVAMGKMNQLDSFLKEAQRVYGSVGTFGIRRVARGDFAFSDGTVIPAGTEIAVAALATNTDERNYENPLEFRPWRFFDKRKQEGESIRHRMITPSLDFIFFGLGRTACPGRFFAVNELKALMSYVLLNFDVKMDRPPSSMWLAGDQLPDQSSKVLFRKRVRTS
ncbi:cytochrome P450 [Desarmillaria tabescens]|uniref:Cytochrome P450 n=1 Tax=Armillaria tabescens TaxID=1929756 RepID=A0AA39MX06_ARMTA|nr:cytochrome P450 [Desarmillaria tabescens]KAK0448940.1 cytochrome P450 [Desarmillaria tabescens]